ncbi:MAG: hypothetical protein BGO98_33270 [Myxococcales bacterium 68-20]|nr:MAG: hypothetical protein BGO98_33270 [Myxococcales bacterium 68-20]
MLLRVLAVVSGVPVAATMLANACGGQVAREEGTGKSNAPAPKETADSSTSSGGVFDPTTPPTDPPEPKPAPPADCPKPLREPRAERCLQEKEWSESVCFPLPEDGGSCASRYSESCILWSYSCGLVQGGDSIACTIPATDACCWQVRGDCAVGRPFIVDGHALLAPLALGEQTWTVAELATRLEGLGADLDPAARAAIANVWSHDGLAEHASVASFARFILELLTLGAPAELVASAQRALGEEVAHAERCFSIASIYAGAPRGPGALDTRGALASSLDLAGFAARTAAEGCIAETVAALQLHASADATREPALASLLRMTAEEEAEHALLAWRAVRWAIDLGGAPVREAVGAVFASAATHVGFGPCPDESIDEAVLHAHGILSRRERHDLAVAALASVIAPAGRELLAYAGSPATSSERMAVA